MADGKPTYFTTPPVRAIDLSRPRRIHLVGIGGAGMSAIAIVLAAAGHHLSGSDQVDSATIARLRSAGIDARVGHDATLVASSEIVARSTAIRDENPEIAAVLGRGDEIFRRDELLAAVTGLRRSVAVAGTHGKTTTSSMLTVILLAAERSPSFIIGGNVAGLGTGASLNDGEDLVVEADESDGTFLRLQSAAAIVTSVEPDHLDYYLTSETFEAAFVEFLIAVPGPRILCIDDEAAVRVSHSVNATTYGTNPDAEFQITGYQSHRRGSRFEITHRGAVHASVELTVPGLHNARNATAALLMAEALGVPTGQAVTGLAEFGGVARRYERRGSVAGVTFIDDYAHLPSEVELTLEGAVSGGWSRVISVFQPHRFTRTSALGRNFADSFAHSNVVFVTSIYTAGESPIEGVTGAIVSDAVAAAHPSADVRYVPERDDLVDGLVAELRAGDLCLTMGAGDLTTLPDEVMTGLEAEVVALETEVSSTMRGAVSAGHPIGPMTTYRVGGASLLYVEPADEADLMALAQILHRGEHRLPIVVVGLGSNLLVADDGFAGVVVHLGDSFGEVAVDGTTVTAGAAASLPVVARQSVRHGLTGFEWAVGVPGSIGGAVRMNAGGHGSNMAASLVSATVVDLTDGSQREWSPDELDFGYRRSALQPHHCVVRCRLDLEVDAAGTGEDSLSEIVRWRRANQPGGQNAGSVFTNPDGDSAGRLIDVSGGKGVRVGSAEVSDKHANFIQVDDGGRADDVIRLMAVIADLVESKTGVRLQPETHLLGFDPAASQLTASDPTALDPTAFDPTALESTGLDPTAFDPTALESTGLDPTAFGPTALESTALDPTAFDPTASDSTALESGDHQSHPPDTKGL